MDRDEFLDRVQQWWDLVFAAQNSYAFRMLDRGRPASREGDAQLLADMAKAEEYAEKYLPPDVIEEFLSGASPAGDESSPHSFDPAALAALVIARVKEN